MNGDVLGRVDPPTVQWYVLDNGEVVSFHVAYTNKERTESIIFFSDAYTWPVSVATKLRIPFTYIRNATKDEAHKFILESEMIIEKIIEV